MIFKPNCCFYFSPFDIHTQHNTTHTHTHTYIYQGTPRRQPKQCNNPVNCIYIITEEIKEKQQVGIKFANFQQLPSSRGLFFTTEWVDRHKIVAHFWQQSSRQTDVSSHIWWCEWTRHMRYPGICFDRMLTYRHVETTALQCMKGSVSPEGNGCKWYWTMPPLPAVSKSGAQCHGSVVISVTVSWHLPVKSVIIPLSPLQIKYCVPQGSVLGPILFILYTTPLSSIIANHTVNFSQMIHSSRNPLLLVKWPTHQRTQCMHNTNMDDQKSA